jgi:AraC family transcriptional regulator
MSAIPFERPAKNQGGRPFAPMYGRSLAEAFRTPDYDCRIAGANGKPEFAVTRLRSAPKIEEKAPEYPLDNAVLICVSLTPARLDQWRAVYNGRKVGVTRAIPFATTFIDLNCSMEMWAHGPFDYLHYYLSSGLLARIALDNGLASSFQLREDFFIEDLVVAEMTKSILTPVTYSEPLDRLALDHVGMMLGAHILQARCGFGKFGIMPKRGL